MTEEQIKILHEAQQLFLSEGFYKTSMDSVASRLKISKKTIYKYFHSKDELVKESILNFVKENQNSFSDLVKSEHNAVEKCFLMFSYVGKMLVKIDIKFLNDIRNFTPELWNQIDEMRTKVLSLNMKRIIEQGQAEGFIIDTSSDVLINVFVTSIRGIVNPETIITNNLSPASAAQSIIEILMNGILTPKGKKIFNNLKAGESK